MSKKVMEEIENFQKKLKEEKKILSKKFKDAFPSFFSEIFEEFPRLKAFKFTAFTPYFNDGDTCEYEVNDVEEFLLVDEKEFRDEYDFEGQDEKMIDKISSKINKIIRKIDDSFYKDAFGDHTEIIVYSNKVKTEEYEHD
jgi:hypothetical protein